MYNILIFSFRVSMVQTLNALSGTQDLIVMKYQYHKSLLITLIIPQMDMVTGHLRDVILMKVIMIVKM